jgi:formimidoylglutamate deiminase
MTDVRLWAERAFLPAGWQSDVLLEAQGGRWRTVAPGVRPAPAGATVVAGPLLPAVVSAHSHAFQRAFAGLAERREAAADDFWSWRDRMYQVALRIMPEQLRAIAAQLYVELLAGGYTQVCEFHYLQHDRDGRAYADPLALSWALAEAADEAGIGLTLLPVLYERAGFAQPDLRHDQRRFRLTAPQVWQAHSRIAASRRPLLRAGLAIHSLRAAAPASLHALRALAADCDGPIHIHVAEQTAEVDDCAAATGARPIEWLARERLLDARWQLVHATHATRAEIGAVAASGAGVVLCPSTEANLGDGLADLPGWLDAGVALAIGSDSQVTRDWREELRWLDYGQRLALRRRNVAADPQSGQSSTAQRLVAGVVAAGARACGEPLWGLAPGARADALVAAPHADALLGVPPEHWLDALVFSSPAAPWAEVMVAGRWLRRGGVHAGAEPIARRFEAAMAELWPLP